MKIFSKLGKFYIGDLYYGLESKDIRTFNINMKQNDTCFLFPKLNTFIEYKVLDNGEGIYPFSILPNKENKIIENEEEFLHKINPFGISEFHIDCGILGLVPIELINLDIEDTGLIIPANEAEIIIEDTGNLLIKFYSKNLDENIIKEILSIEFYCDSFNEFDEKTDNKFEDDSIIDDWDFDSDDDYEF